MPPRHDLVHLTTAPNEPIARMWEEILTSAGVPVLVRPGGPGFGGWGSVATFEHDLYVRPEDQPRALQIMEEEAGLDDDDWADPDLLAAERDPD
jgi:hypothetical protein